MPAWREDDVRVNGLRLHYYRTGGDKPPLVMVHGFTDNALYWTRTAEALAPDWDVVLYDARGHGLSDRAGGRFSDADRAADLAELVRALGLQKPALMGHSMGGSTITYAAAQHPDLARCIVLEDPAWVEAPTHETPEAAAQYQAVRAAYFADWKKWLQGLQAGSREFGLSQIKANSPNWSEIDQNLSLNARLQVETDLFELFGASNLEWRRLLPDIQCPILLLLGDNRARNAIITVEQANEAAGLWAHGRWVQIKGAGHAIRYDQFEQYLEVVRAFLNEMK